MANLKELSRVGDLISGGHRACAGCGPMIAVRQVLLAAGKDTVVSCATGCLEVISTIYPYTAWRVPFIHSAFENAAATISGIEAAYRSFRRKGKINKRLNFIGIGGDGGTYDIGLQALSGALERRHRFLYICYDNEAYMNTGIQRSSATPHYAHTTTSPVGEVIPGKTQLRKDLTEIVIAHEPVYAAQTTIAYWNDLITKVKRALSADGPSFLNILSPCPLGWGYPMERTIEVSRLSVETGFWPLYEYENGSYHLNYRPMKRRPLAEFLQIQDRFRHLLKEENRELLDELQHEVDERWERLERLAEKG
jgi:pyruvate ferredoxin oxidoreductase beta subunit